MSDARARLIELIRAAHGEHAADLRLDGARVLDVFTGELHDTSVGIRDGLVCGLGEIEAGRAVDLDGGILVPGLIDAHVHIESSMLTVRRFAEAVVPHGTTTVVTGLFHLGRDRLEGPFRRDESHYVHHFTRLLALPHRPTMC